MNNEIVILKEVDGKVYEDYYFIMARLLISFEEATNINGDIRMGLWDDPAEYDLITCITKSGVVCYLKEEDREQVGIIDVQS